MTESHPQDFAGNATRCGLRFVDQIFVGACVVWLHTPRGGYGYTIRIPATVRSLNRHTGRATIEAALAKGGTRMVTVSVASLRWANQ